MRLDNGTLSKLRRSCWRFQGDGDANSVCLAAGVSLNTRRPFQTASSSVLVSVVTAVGEGDGIENEYEAAIKSLDTRFKRCRNVTLERHQFYKRVQADGKSASIYVGALRRLAVSCDYKDFEEEMIKDQLVEKTNNKKEAPRCYSDDVVLLGGSEADALFSSRSHLIMLECPALVVRLYSGMAAVLVF
ncbi:hypothetical protein NDU88_000641 [Pleurodeles waltl]|uniref:Uncharacterized protein n=1 Tax=Pleurodeles waltl TaxID=8319 RepID=A0AAV7MJ65_PLEWA|nr:hypothetical protein NDU88_000641 [Pleurodeles waltl]